MLDVDFTDFVNAYPIEERDHVVEDKEALRVELAHLVASFLQSGGIIRVVPAGVRADVESNFNGSIQSTKVTAQTRRGIRSV